VAEFVAESLPPGLPMAQAVRRVQGATAACGPAASDGVVECRYFIEVRPDGGDAGEDGWRVRLVPTAGGLLGAATASRYHVGMEGIIDE
jgi:hypothetical protein